MAALLLIPEAQFIDADGNPYAGGTLATYVPGTTTGKATWQDAGQTIFNGNPIVLDAAGRCVVWGDGEYRLILRDAIGNIIWDQLSTTLISAAMAPVCIAPDLPTARRVMGIDDAIAAAVAAEAATRAAADAAEAAARAAADSAEAAARQAADDAERAAREAADTALGARIDGLAVTYQHGTSITSSSGYARVTFGTAFSGAPAFIASVLGTDFTSVCLTCSADTTGADVRSCFMDTAVGPTGFAWIAIGS